MLKFCNNVINKVKFVNGKIEFYQLHGSQFSKILRFQFDGCRKSGEIALRRMPDERSDDKPPSGERTQPTACPEPVEGTQAVGHEREKLASPEGAKDPRVAILLEGLNLGCPILSRSLRKGGHRALISFEKRHRPRLPCAPCLH